MLSLLALPVNIYQLSTSYLKAQVLVFLTFTLLNFINGLIQIPFWNSLLLTLGIEDVNLKLDEQLYTAWPDCIDIQAGLAL